MHVGAPCIARRRGGVRRIGFGGAAPGPAARAPARGELVSSRASRISTTTRGADADARCGVLPRARRSPRRAAVRRRDADVRSARERRSIEVAGATRASVLQGERWRGRRAIASRCAHARRSGRDGDPAPDARRRARRPLRHDAPRAAIVRPLLDVAARELQDFLRARQERGAKTRPISIGDPRNRVRHAVMPGLERDQRAGGSALARAAELARETNFSRSLPTRRSSDRRT